MGTRPLPQLMLKQGKERAVLQRHPWVYSGAVQGLPPEVPDGAVVAVCLASGTCVGLGHYQNHGSLVCRVFHWGEDPFMPTAEFWHLKLEAALALRQRLLGTAHTGYRMVNAEGDGLPGLVIDRYAHVAVVQARTAGMQQLVPLVGQWLARQQGITAVLAHTRADDAQAQPEVLAGTAPIEPVPFTEHGFTFLADVTGGQKTGFFLDQREARHLVGGLCQGRRVLNAFSYSGAFSVYALASGAAHVLNLDSSTSALALAEQTLQLNNLTLGGEQVNADVFEYLRQASPGDYDCIILDPPAFTKHISTQSRAARGYKDINLRALRLLPPGGLLATFSCSQHIDRVLFRQIVFGAAADAGRPVRLLYQTGHAPDHPVDLFHPEGEYLKGLILQVE